MNVKVCIVLPLAVLLVAVCVSADRAHVEKAKGAHKNWGQMKALPRARAEARGAGNFVVVPDVGVPVPCTAVATECFKGVSTNCATSCSAKCTPAPTSTTVPTDCNTCLETCGATTQQIEAVKTCIEGCTPTVPSTP